MGKFRKWIAAVIWHYWFVLGGTTFGVVGLMVQQYLPTGRLEPWPFYALCVIGLAGAMFLAWRDEHDALEAVRLMERPKLRVTGVSTKPFFIYNQNGSQSQAMMFNVKVMNDPEGTSASCIAMDVRPRLTFLANGVERLAVDGRWDNTPQPQPFQPKVVPTTLGIGEERALHVAVLFPDDACPFAFNNYSYDHPGMKSPTYRLPDREYHINVRLRGVGVDMTTHLFLKRDPHASAPHLEVLQ